MQGNRLCEWRTCELEAGGELTKTVTEESPKERVGECEDLEKLLYRIGQR